MSLCASILPFVCVFPSSQRLPPKCSSDTESAEVKQPMTKTQRLKNIFAKRLQRGGGAGTNELPEEIVTTPDVAAVDEQDTKPSDGAGKPAKVRYF